MNFNLTMMRLQVFCILMATTYYLYYISPHGMDKMLGRLYTKQSSPRGTKQSSPRTGLPKFTCTRNYYETYLHQLFDQTCNSVQHIAAPAVLCLRELYSCLGSPSLYMALYVSSSTSRKIIKKFKKKNNKEDFEY